MARFTKKKKIVVITAAMVLAGGAAFAYWTTSGTGTGSVDTGTTAGITINQDSVLVDMFPGQGAQDLEGTFGNTNDGPVYVTQVTVAVAPSFSVQTDPGKPACVPADFALVQPTATNEDIAVGDPVGAWDGASIELLNRATNQDNCKNLAAVPLVYTSN